MTDPSQPAPVAADARRRTLGFVALTVAMVAWSLGSVLVKGSSLSGLTFAMCRLWVGAGISVIALLVTRRRLPWATFRACAFGGVLFAVDIGLGFTSVNHTSVANLGVIGALSPVVIAILSAKLLGERIARRDAALVGLSFVGVVVVVIGGAGESVTSPFGDFLAFLGIGSWVSYWFFSRHTRARYGPIEYFACVMIAGALTITPIAFLFEGVPAWPTATDWAAVVTVALLPGFVGHSLVIWSHRYVESWRSAMFTQLVPVLSAALAWAVIDEPITKSLVLGGAIVVASSVAVIVSAARRESALDAPMDVPT